MGLILAAPVQAREPDPAKYLVDTVPSRWQYVSDIPSVSPENDKWWKNFNDVILDSLIETAITNNFNVSIAAHRMEIARQTLKQARSQYFPSLNFQGGWSKSRTSGAMTTDNGQAVNSSYFSLGLDMSWQIDLFGKITAQSRNREALYKASRAELDGMLVSVAAETATYYINLRVLQAQLQVATQHLESQARIVKITEVRYDTGLASKLDVAQARALYLSTQASIPSLENAINSTISSIALMLGVYPGQIIDMLSREANLPDYHQPVALGIPMDLLRRRPDIIEAEYNVAAYAAALGIAKKDFLPTLTLDGSIGTTAHSFDHLFKNNSFTYTIAPTLSWTLFDGLSRNYALASAREQMQSAIDSYNLTVMTAVREADVALSDYHFTLRTIDLDKQVYDESATAFELSMDQYKNGLQSLTPVVDAQMNMLTYSNSLVTQKGNALLDLIDLYKALGGGWSDM